MLSGTQRRSVQVCRHDKLLYLSSYPDCY